MLNVKDITRESWILGAFPEWGTWLNEEIDEAKVEPGTFKMWWIGNTGLWIKTENDTNIAVDLWFGNGKRTQKVKEMIPYHQMANMSGGRLLQPNRRAAPIVYDPFAVTKCDAVLSSHYHNDHICPFFAAAVLQNCGPDVPFIGPEASVKRWLEWGVPEDRCKVVKPGDDIQVGDTTICCVESFDRTCFVTADHDLKGELPDLTTKAVNFIIKTPAGTIYDGADSHYSVMFAKHGKEHDIDIAFCNYGENPVGCQDKMTSVDLLRMAEALRCKVLIPFHYDVWTNFKADPNEIVVNWQMKKDRLEYKFHPFIWEVGGSYTWPNDQDKRYYHYRRGFEDCFTHEPNVPFPGIL